jgi:hypothetical protein
MQQSQKGFEALVDGKIYWFIPFVAMCLVDWPEACAYCMTYNSYNCQHPCHFCLVKRENLNNMQLHSDQIILRTHTTMQQAIAGQSSQEKSIHPLNNFFWEFW